MNGPLELTSSFSTLAFFKKVCEKNHNGLDFSSVKYKVRYELAEQI